MKTRWRHNRLLIGRFSRSHGDAPVDLSSLSTPAPSLFASIRLDSFLQVRISLLALVTLFSSSAVYFLLLISLGISISFFVSFEENSRERFHWSWSLMNNNKCHGFVFLRRVAHWDEKWISALTVSPLFRRRINVSSIVIFRVLSNPVTLS